jgi:ABC-type sugar transport system ATPase subunit
MELLRVNRVSKGEPTVLKEISFTQQHFQNLAIVGETGSGKSTLLRTVAGLVQPDGGEVLFEGNRVRGPLETLIPGHPGIAYLSQQYELRHHYTVAEVLTYANKLSEEEARRLYDVCQISHLLPRKTHELSGGEAQRVALCRLLITLPRLLLLDEPYSNGDAPHTALLKGVIRDIGEQLDITCTLVSHDPLDVLSWADEVLVLREGAIVQQGSPQQLYRQPVNEYVAGLFGSYNLIPAQHLSLLAPLPGIVLNGKNALIRPEAIKLVGSGESTVAALVTGVRFFGAYYETDVAVGPLKLTVRTSEATHGKGDTVQLSVHSSGVWYLD